MGEEEPRLCPTCKYKDHSQSHRHPMLKLQEKFNDV